MIQWPNIGLWGEFLPCEADVRKAINTNFKILDTLVQMRVLDFVTELPLNPSPGDRYILEDDSYLYSGAGSVIVVWNEQDGEWEFITPQTGYLSFVLSTQGLYWFNGNDWVELPINPVQGPNSAQNREIAVFDGTTGKWITGSGVFIEQDQSLYQPTSIYVDNLILNDNQIYSDTGLIAVESDLALEKHLSVRSTLEFYEEDSNISGDDQTLPNPKKVITKLINSGLNSIETISSGKSKFIILTNKTGGVVTIKNATGNIITGLDGDLEIENDASIMLYYSTNWHVIGGTGSGGGGGGSGLSWYRANGYEGVSDDYPLLGTAGLKTLNFKNPWDGSDNGQSIFTKISVPSSYKAGKQISLINSKIFTTVGAAAQMGFRILVSLLRAGSLTAVSTREFTAHEYSLSNIIADGPVLEVTDSNGEVGGERVQAGDILMIQLMDSLDGTGLNDSFDFHLIVDDNNNGFDLKIG